MTNVTEIPRDTNDLTLTGWGAPLADQMFFAIVNGSSGDETFDAATLTAPTRTLMDSYQRGVTVNLGDGNDTVVGSAYGDSIAMGAGTDMIDGGTNLGVPPGGGGKAIDSLEVYVATTAHADALAVTALDGNSTGADADAFNGGYSFKVVNGTGVAYIKNIEQIYVRLSGGKFIKNIALAVSVHEIANPSSTDLANYVHYAWAQGTERGDTFTAATDISSATQTLMDSHGRGVYIDMGAGNDTVTGSAYGDHIIAGSGINHVDGGANGGTPPWGGKAVDVLQVMVADKAAADALQVIALSTSTGSDEDKQAATDGYAYKVVNAAGGEFDYIKNVEKVTVLLKGVEGSAAFVREIALAVSVRELDLADSNTAKYAQLAFVTGTGSADTIDLSGDSALLSSAVKTEMAASKRGVWVDGGAGNDIVTGTAYADVFRNGSGNAKIDGGANEAAGAKHGQDVFEIQVANQTEMDAVQVSVSDDVNYSWKVTYGTGQVDYLKNIEAITIFAATGASKSIPLAVTVNEIQDTSIGSLNSATHYAWASGTVLGDTFNAATDISTATRTLMSGHERGVYVDLGAGNDTIVGSEYGDYLIAGAGINYIDGGANGGTAQFGGAAQDVLQVTVADKAAADALQVVQLSTSTGSATDMAAAADGYVYKIVNAGETDYIKHVESVDVMIAGTSGGATFTRNIALQVSGSGVANNSAPVFSSLGGTFEITGLKPVLIDSDASVLDANLTGSSYQGAQLTLARHGGANADDVFGASGDVSISGTDIKVGTVVVGAVTQTGGSLDIVFNDMASQTMVNSVLQGLSYANSSGTPPASVTLDWTFSDGNSGAQGAGGAMSATGSTEIKIGTVYSELSAKEVTESTAYLATLEGTVRGDTVDAGAGLLSSGTKALMEQYHKGIQMTMAGGDDSVTGSAYGDLFDLGSGTNHVNGGGGLDVLRVVVDSSNDVDAVAITNLDAQSTGADAAAFAAGYKRKLVNGAEVDYLKGIEKIDIRVGPDLASAKQIEFVRVFEVSREAAGDDERLAFFNGSEGGDNIDVAHDVSAASLTLMTDKQRGVKVEMGAGDDSVIGSAYGDEFLPGAGTKMIDGGTNFGHAPDQTAMARDKIFKFAPTADANAASATLLASDTGTDADQAAFAAGYVFKLVIGDTINYVKNVEEATIVPFDDANKNGLLDNGEQADFDHGKSFRLGLTIDETQADPAKPGFGLYKGPLANEWRLAWANGGGADDNFDVARDISATSRTLMDTYKRGVEVHLGAGNDSAVGSAYGDKFDLGSGTNYLDGGSNLGHAPGQLGLAKDEMDLFVSTPEAAAAAAATPLDGNGSAADKAAFSAGYTFKIVAGDAIDYVKNVEFARVLVWNDANANGQLDGGEDSWFKDVTLGLRVDEESTPNPTDTGQKLAYVNGGDASEHFAPSHDVSSTTLAQMATYQRGVYVEMRGGNDTVLGTAYGDEINLGSGINRVDGGAQNGPPLSWGPAQADVLKVFVADKATLDAMTFTTLQSTSTGADAAAFADGYMYKLVVGSETDYLVNMERIEVEVWNDINKNGGRDNGELSSFKSIPLIATIEQFTVDPLNPDKTTWNGVVKDEYWFAWVKGGPAADHFNAKTDLSAERLSLMAQYGRGVEVKFGDGDNTIVGSDYNDYFLTGHGVNMIDGGTNLGAKPNGEVGDRLEVFAPSVAAGQSVVPIELTGTLSGTDALAQAQGYRYKVVNGDEIDYLKNVEDVLVTVWEDKNGNHEIDGGELSFGGFYKIDSSPLPEPAPQSPNEISLVGSPVVSPLDHLM